MPNRNDPFYQRAHSAKAAPRPRSETEIEYLLTALDEERTARKNQKKLGVAAIVGVGLGALLLGSFALSGGGKNGTALASAFGEPSASLETAAELNPGVDTASITGEQPMPAGAAMAAGATASSRGIQANAGITPTNPNTGGGLQGTGGTTSATPSGGAGGGTGGTGGDGSGGNSGGNSGGGNSGGGNSGGTGGNGSGGTGSGGTGGTGGNGGTGGTGNGGGGTGGNGGTGGTGNGGGGTGDGGEDSLLGLGLTGPNALNVNLDGSTGGATLDADNNGDSLLDVDVDPDDSDSPVDVDVNGDPVVDGGTVPDLPDVETPDTDGLLDDVEDTLDDVLGNQDDGNSLLGGLLN